MSDPGPTFSRPPLNRARLALLLASPALLVVLVSFAATLVTLANLGEGSAEAGLARLGEDLALVIVTDGAVTATGLRELVVNWGLVAPMIALLVAAVAAWLIAGRVARDMQQARTEVESAAHERRSRLEEVVHELRTPLAVMGTNLELAALDAGGDPGPGRYVEAARRAVDRMARTVDDLAGHGRLAVEEQCGPVDLSSLAEAAVAEHVGPGSSRGVHVRLTGKSATTVPSADPAAVRAAIGNFLSNAVRLAPRGSAVTVDWGESGDWAWISVTDEGPGLPPHLHARVFERGWQGPHDRMRGAADAGDGLGLTIARQLTEAQGGVVTLESDEGGGATLAVWLPLDQGASYDTVIAPDRVHPVIHPWRKDLQSA